MQEITVHSAARLPVASLRRTGGAEIRLVPDADWRTDLCAELGLDGLRKLRLEMALSPVADGVDLTGRIGATVVQPCIITLEPVTTRIEADVTRRYRSDLPEPETEETEMPEDESLEPLPEVLDLGTVLIEALALNLPLYPRAEGAELGEATFAPEGAEPIEAEPAKPFAGLGALRDKLDDGGNSDAG